MRPRTLEVINAVTMLVLGLSAILMASCGSDPSTTNALASTTAAPPTTGRDAASQPNSAPEASSAPERTIATTSTSVAASTESVVPTTGADQDQTTTDAEALRLAPPASQATALLTWDRQGYQDLGHAGPLARVEIEALGQVTAVPLSSPVVQISNNERVIWQVRDGELTALIEVPESEALTLEGAGRDAAGEPVIFYQHRTYGDPESTRSTLRTFDVTDQAIVDIASTGGWESGVHLSHLSVIDPEASVVALWGAEGWTWIEILDPGTGNVSFDSQNLGIECFDGDDGCPNFVDAVTLGNSVIGVGPAPVGAEGFVDTFALWRYDTASGDLEVIEQWPWDNGLWYVEDMFMLDGSVVVLSLEDGNGSPLPALSYDLASNESWTEPTAGFVRPAYLS